MIFMNKTGYVIWFYGLPCSGKSTLGFKLANKLAEKGIEVERLDGDLVRKTLTEDLGFSPEDRLTNIKRVAYVAGLLIDHGIFAICSFITPTLQMRLYLRALFGDRLIFIFCNTPLLTCINRDNKGLYKKAIDGVIVDFTGISAPFDNTKERKLGFDEERYIHKAYYTGIEGEENSDDIVEDIIEFLEEKKII